MSILESSKDAFDQIGKDGRTLELSMTDVRRPASALDGLLTQFLSDVLNRFSLTEVDNNHLYDRLLNYAHVFFRKEVTNEVLHQEMDKLKTQVCAKYPMVDVENLEDALCVFEGMLLSYQHFKVQSVSDLFMAVEQEKERSLQELLRKQKRKAKKGKKVMGSAFSSQQSSNKKKSMGN
ncbi:MAG: hypothetical protein AAF990_02330 [Bacteroidota bacterium]